MSGETEYALGVDLRRSPPLTAIGRGDDVAIFTRGDDVSPTQVDGNDEPAAFVRRVADTVERVTAQVAEQEGGPPSAVVLSLPRHRLAGDEDVTGEVARRLGLRPDRVWIIDETEATALGLARLGGAATEIGNDPGSAVAIGAAGAGGGLLAAGAAGAVAGGLGAIAFGAGSAAADVAALGPTGVPLPLTGAPVGPAGVPLGQGVGMGPAGVPLTGAPVGPAGVPLGQGAAVGPGGVPLNTAAGVGPPGVPMGGLRAAIRGHRAAAIAAVATVLVVAVAAVAVASGGSDSPTRTDATSAPSVAPVVAESTSPTDAATTVAPTVVPTSGPNAETTTSTDAGIAGQGVAARCTVGSWLADSRSLVNAIIGSSAALGGFPIENGDVTGSVHVDITADGTVVTTFDNWLLTAILPEGAGTATISETGVETNKVAFADDGSYSVGATQIDSHFTFTAGGTELFTGQLPSGLFQGGSYTCTGDQLVIVNPGVSVSTEIFSRSG